MKDNADTVSKPEVDALVITHKIAASRELVWQAWTQEEHLLHWWGPKGFTLGVKQFELKPGGTFHYSMQVGEKPKMWGKFVYQEIQAPERLVFLNSFADEEGSILRAPFSSTWPLEMLNVLTLTEANGITTLTLKGTPYNASEEENATYIAGIESMQQGFKGTFENLISYLNQINSAK
ncbi:SRPBCC family protein [Rufibacter latericius]|uniref:SRPBCC domain-containing protein n=1 Tax=Rufibacter latericius TaxID=2487040 RepID=A0A3M9MTY3_9BACT|nr:SRPBCC domain-containing protein [Rufibacter latericius]RNI28982.1 SRPBCC domain-containing protein [Rufibacter latericius]